MAVQPSSSGASDYRWRLSPGIMYMLLSTLAYAGVNTCVKQLNHWPTHQVILFRSVISLIITVSILRYQRVSPFWGYNHKWLVIRGLAGVGALYFYFYTLQRIPMASAVTIQYLSPIFTAIGAIFILGEGMKRQRWLFFLLSFVGVLFVKGIDTRLGMTDLVMGLLGALCSGLAYNAIRKLGAKENTLTIVMYFPLIALPITGLACLIDWHQPVGTEWLWGLAMGLFTQLGQVTATKAIQLESLGKVTFLNYLGVLYALGIGFIFYGEGYDPISMLGMVLVIAGVVLNLADQDKMRRMKRKVLKRNQATLNGQ